MLSPLNSLFLPTEPGKDSIFQTRSGPACRVSQHGLLSKSKGRIVASWIRQGPIRKRKKKRSFYNRGNVSTQGWVIQEKEELGSLAEAVMQPKVESCHYQQGRKDKGKEWGWQSLGLRSPSGSWNHGTCLVGPEPQRSQSCCPRSQPNLGCGGRKPFLLCSSSHHPVSCQLWPVAD